METFDEIRRLRAQPGADQEMLAPKEHRAYAREYTQDNPFLAVPSLSVAIPAYAGAKALGLIGARTKPSLNQMKESYLGIWDGLRSLSGGPSIPGNMDLSKRPQVKNADGSTSTVRTIGISTDSGYVNIPTVSDEGQVMTNEAAIAQFKKTGQHLGVYKDKASGDAAAKKLSEDQRSLYGLSR